MCNLYNLTTSQQAILQWTRTLRDLAGNLEASFDVYPNNMAPVVRKGVDGERELARLTWGMPTPPERVKGNADRGTTNIRKSNWHYWQQFLSVENRCLVPVTSFAEPSPVEGDKDPDTGIQRNFWFARNRERPIFFFAGVWTKWSGVKKVKDGPQDFELFGFLTTDPNDIVKPIHEDAMPVILATEEEANVWMNAGWSEARGLQRPAANDTLIIVDKPATQIKFPQVSAQGSLF